MDNLRELEFKILEQLRDVHQIQNKLMNSPMIQNHPHNDENCQNTFSSFNSYMGKGISSRIEGLSGSKSNQKGKKKTHFRKSHKKRFKYQNNVINDENKENMKNYQNTKMDYSFSNEIGLNTKFQPSIDILSRDEMTLEDKFYTFNKNLWNNQNNEFHTPVKKIKNKAGISPVHEPKININDYELKKFSVKKKSGLNKSNNSIKKSWNQPLPISNSNPCISSGYKRHDA